MTEYSEREDGGAICVDIYDIYDIVLCEEAADAGEALKRYSTLLGVERAANEICEAAGRYDAAADRAAAVATAKAKLMGAVSALEPQDARAIAAASIYEACEAVRLVAASLRNQPEA